MGRGEEVADRVPLKMGFVSMGAKKMKPVCVASMNCLPDELLVQILSFLPTRKAASTSVLSKRWRHLFTFSHHLDIDYSFFWLPKKSKSKNFREFVDRTLALQGGNRIQTFSVKFKGHDIDGHGVVVVKSWIRNALEHGVSELHLCLDSIYGRSFQSFDFPSKVFTNTTLVKLSLGTYQHIPSLPSNTYLPALKVLSLDSIWFERDQLSDVFLAACPTLEDLTIHHKSSSKVPPKIISSKTIKKLSVTINFNYSDYGFDYSDYDFDYIGMISLDIPSVVDLYYSDYSQRQYPRCNFDSLVKATLDLHFLDADADVTNLISGIRNVKALHLISSAVKVISVCCKGGLPMFNNLIDLVFSSKIGGRKWLLERLLKNSPNLKTLVLSDLDYACRKNHFVQNQIPFNNQIKMLSIMQYEGRENELKHISHFFLNMKSLEVVKVYVARSMDDTKKMQLTEDLLKLPTASSKLKIQVM